VYCNQCGKENIESSKFCGGCGHKFDVSPPLYTTATVRLPPHPILIVSLSVIGSYASIVCFILLLKELNTPFSNAHPVYYIFLIISSSIGIAASVLQFIFLYRLWQLAQASNLNITKPLPGKAIGFAFIPFYGFYWVFILYRNLSLHLNSLTKNTHIPVTFVTIGVSVAVASMALFFVPFLGPVLTPLGQIIILITLFYFYKSAEELLGNESA